MLNLQIKLYHRYVCIEKHSILYMYIYIERYYIYCSTNIYIYVYIYIYIYIYIHIYILEQTMAIMGSDGKESACNVGDLCSIPGLGRSPGAEKDYPLQYSGLKSPMDCVDHGVAKSWIRLSELSLHFIVNFLLCLTYKLNFIIGMYV